MRVLLLSRYGRLGASSRVRLFQYLPFLESKGWQVDINPLFSDAYVQSLYCGQSRGRHVLTGYWQRLKVLLGAGKYDLIWIEKEIFPFMPALAEWLLAKKAVPYIVDYDDALFHNYDRHQRWLIRLLLGRKIDSVMKHASLVIAGNEYLADRAHGAGARQVEIVPTVVDLTRYKVAQSTSNTTIVVGWIGSPSTSHYLSIVAPVISSLSKEFDVRFVAVGVNEEAVRDLPIEPCLWSEETEVQSIQGFDIGIMPLPDNPWERGKCGYKLIQYMACGKPVVASPVGANTEIVEQGINGFLAGSPEEWQEALTILRNNPDLREKMGLAGRKIVEKKYCMQVTAPKLLSIFKSIRGRCN